MNNPRDVLTPAVHNSRFIAVGDLKLHYLDYGSTGHTPLVCLHGGAANAHWFDFIAGSFREDHHVIALDLRGHGDSSWAIPPAYPHECYVADLAQIVTKLDLGDFVLMGHSMGGAVALMYAATHPGRVTKLIVIDSTMHMPRDRIALLREVGTREAARFATREEFVARFRLRPGGTRATPEVVRYIAQHSARQLADGHWRHKFDRNVYATREPLDFFPYWDRVHIPALLVKGDRSDRITSEVYAQVKARSPQAVLAEVANSEHHVTLDNPSGFVAAVRNFLASSDEGTANKENDRWPKSR